MEKNAPLSAAQAVDFIWDKLTAKHKLVALDSRGRAKAQVFAVGTSTGRQLAIIVGDRDPVTGRSMAQTTRILLEPPVPPPIAGTRPSNKGPYMGSRIRTQKDSRLKAPNQISLQVGDEVSLESLVEWYVNR